MELKDIKPVANGVRSNDDGAGVILALSTMLKIGADPGHLGPEDFKRAVKVLDSLLPEVLEDNLRRLGDITKANASTARVMGVAGVIVRELTAEVPNRELIPLLEFALNILDKVQKHGNDRL